MNPTPAAAPPLSKPRWITQTALFLALAIVLPVGLHAFGIAGRVFLPMHFPVLLAGFLVGPYSGLVVGLLAPGISYLTTGMPPTYAVPLMTLELPLYGLVAGLAYQRLQLNIYVALIAAMIVGRLMFGLGLFVLGMFMELPYGAVEFFSTAGPILTGIWGIIAQVVLIPLIVAAVRRSRQSEVGQG
ncbi:MAG: ECF transporter S component [Candidatus Zixiibacteriota bacterium]